MREHNGDAEGNIGGGSAGEGSRDGGGEEIMPTGPSECETYFLSASYRRDSTNNHMPAVLPVAVLGGEEECAGCGDYVRPAETAAKTCATPRASMNSDNSRRV